MAQPHPPELVALRDQGMGAIVSLTEEPMEVDAVLSAGLRYEHLPIADMHAPTSSDIVEFVTFVDNARKTGLATAVHCRAGLGRTGTMIASYLVHEGESWETALARVRQQRPGSIETMSQEQAVRDFATMLNPQGQRV